VDALAQIAAEPAAAALFLDIDGVLAPIVDRPEDARVPPETREELRRLGGLYGLVACVTGRPTEIARGIVGVDGLTYVGEHGLELAPEAARWAEPIHAFAAEVPWSDVEVKPLSVAFHYRTAPDAERAREELEGVAAAALDLLVGVVEAALQAAREQPPDSGLARAHHADKDESAFGFHGVILRRWKNVQAENKTAGRARPFVDLRRRVSGRSGARS